jgi:ATP-dependent Clp protease, protease subunit
MVPLMPRILDPQVNIRSQDVFTLLLDRREVWVVGEIMDESAIYWTAAVQHLAHKDPNADIKMVINSPGGSISAGMALYDVMQGVPCDIQTVCLGMAASFGAVLLCAGTKGKRLVAPNARVLIHQPLGGARGEATDIQLQAEEMIRLKRMLNKLISHHTGQPFEQVEKDTDRDKIMSAKESIAYGLADAMYGDGPMFNE